MRTTLQRDLLIPSTLAHQATFATAQSVLLHQQVSTCPWELCWANPWSARREHSPRGLATPCAQNVALAVIRTQQASPIVDIVPNSFLQNPAGNLFASLVQKAMCKQKVPQGVCGAHRALTAQHQTRHASNVLREGRQHSWRLPIFKIASVGQVHTGKWEMGLAYHVRRA